MIDIFSISLGGGDVVVSLFFKEQLLPGVFRFCLLLSGRNAVENDLLDLVNLVSVVFSSAAIPAEFRGFKKILHTNL